MTRILIFLCVCVSSYAQLIYPDQYERMKTSTLPTYSNSNNNRQSRVETQASSTIVVPPQQINTQYSQIPPVGLASDTYQPTYSAQQSVVTENPLQEWDDHVNNIITRGIEKFALDIERQIYKTRMTDMAGHRENIIFSPLNLSVVLAMVLLGSAGRTFDEISKVLGLEAGVDISRHSEVVHQMFGLLLSRVHDKFTNSVGPRIDSASAVFVQDGYPIREEFRTITQHAYQSDVINVDFLTKAKEAQKTINSWVYQNTMGKIQSILDKTPRPETSVILLSALYFKGEWNQHFYNGVTKRKPFYIEENEAVDVDMMYNGGTFPFYEDTRLGVKVLSLPYKGLETSMYVLLPTAKGATALRNFQNQLTPEILETLINSVENETCIIGLPRMKLSSTLSLSSTLRALGLSSLFDPRTADLSLLSPGYTGQSLSARTPPPTATVPSPLLTNTISAGRNVMRLKNNDDVLIFSRFNGDNGMQRNFFTYEDKIRGLTVQQWATGFSISRLQRIRRGLENSKQESQEELKSTKSEQSEDHGHSYVVNDRKQNSDRTKVVNLEQNKYRFQAAETKQTIRRKRQDRPMNQDFLNYVRAKNFPSFGLDNLRNSANLVNPGLYASDVLHKVDIEITERGTEAAAVSGVVLDRDGSQKRLIANRPFIFFIRHNPSKLLLFWGTLNTPTPNYRVT